MIAKLRPILIATLFVLATVTTYAQSKRAPIVAREGFWVTETPAKGQYTIVRFYTNQNQLVYEETIERRLNIARQQTKRQLNTALEQAMFVWNATHKVPTERQWVAAQFAGRR
ncbi:hypothetical protein [Spirosoma montaniterrae]|nr:hypothetical protein [Spirosoma montaniterrae]